MQRTMLKSKIHEPRVVHVDAHNQIIDVDQQVATLLSAPTS
jgi:aspartate 1-decarboxylase